MLAALPRPSEEPLASIDNFSPTEQMSPECLATFYQAPQIFQGSSTFPPSISRKANVNVLRKSRSSTTRRYTSSTNPITKHTNTHRCQIERDNTEVKALFSYLSHLYRAGCGVEETPPIQPISYNQIQSSPFANKANHSQHQYGICATAAGNEHIIENEILPTAHFVENSLSLFTSAIKDEELLNNLFFSNYPFLTTSSVPNELSDDQKRLNTVKMKKDHSKSNDSIVSNSIGNVKSVYSPFLQSGILPLHILLEDLPGVVLNENQKYLMSPFLAAMQYLESINEGFYGMTFSESKELSHGNDDNNDRDNSNNDDDNNDENNNNNDKNDENNDSTNNIDLNVANDCSNDRIMKIDEYLDIDVIAIQKDMVEDRLMVVSDNIENCSKSETVEEDIVLEETQYKEENKNGNHAEYSTKEILVVTLPVLVTASELEKNNYANTLVEKVEETFFIKAKENTTMIEADKHLYSAAIQLLVEPETDARSSILMPMCDHHEIQYPLMKDIEDLPIESFPNNQLGLCNLRNDYCLTEESGDNLPKVGNNNILRSEYKSSVDLIRYYKSLLSKRGIRNNASLDVVASPCLSSFLSSSLDINVSTYAFLGPEMPYSTVLTAAINYINSCVRSPGCSSDIPTEGYNDINDNVIIKSESIPMLNSRICNNDGNETKAFLSPPFPPSGMEMISTKIVDTSSPFFPTSCSSSSLNASSTSFSSFYIAASSTSSSSLSSSCFLFSSSSSSSSSSSLFCVESSIPRGGLPKVDDLNSNIVSGGNNDNDNDNVDDNNNFNLRIDTSSSSSSSSRDNIILLTNNLHENKDNSSGSSSRFDFKYPGIQTDGSDERELRPAPVDSSLLLSFIPPFYLSSLALTSQNMMEFKNKLTLDHNSYDNKRNYSTYLNSKESSTDNESNDKECSDLRLSGVENAIKYLLSISRSNANVLKFENSDVDNTSSEESSLSPEDPIFEDSSPINISGEYSAAEAALIDISKAVHLSDRILNLKDYPLWGHPTQLKEATYTQNLCTDSNNLSAAFSDLFLSMEVDILHFGEVVREQIKRSQYPLSLSFLGGQDGGKGSVLTPVDEIDIRGEASEKSVRNNNNDDSNDNDNNDDNNINNNNNNNNSCIDEDANGIHHNLKTLAGSSTTTALYQSIQPLPSVQPLLSLTSFQALPIETFLPSYDDTSGAIALLALMSDCVCFKEFDCYFNDDGRNIPRNIISSNLGEKIEKTVYKRRENDEKNVDSKSTELRKRKFVEDSTHDFSTSRRQQKCPKCGEYKKGHICSYNRRNDFFYAEK